MFRILEEELATVVKELIDRNKGGIFYVHFCKNCTLKPYRVGWTLFDLVDKDKFYESYGEKTFFTRTKAQAVADELNKKFAEDNPIQKVNVVAPAHNANRPENTRDTVRNDNWILIAERLPEMCKDVLVTVTNTNGTRSVDWDYYTGETRGWHKYPNRVIAWTQYPNAYNGSVI